MLLAPLYGIGGDAAQSFLGELADRIDVARGLLSGCYEAFNRIGDLNEKVGASFSSLHQQAASLQGIVGIVGDVRLIGLNAHLKSDGLGHEGRTLSAISRELRTSADLITVHARNLIDSIDDTLARFEQLKTHNDAVAPDRVRNLIDDMAQALNAFEDCGKRLAEALAALSDEGRKVRLNLEASSMHIRGHDDLARRLEMAREDLVRVGQMNDVSGESETAAAVFTSFFADRYTMAAERNIHSAQHSDVDWHSASSGSAIAHTSNDNLEDIFF